MAEISVLQFIGSIGGIAGVLAFVIFWMYRAQVSQMRDDRKYMEDRLSKIIENYDESCQAHTAAMIKHTQVLTELIVYLKAKNGGK